MKLNALPLTREIKLEITITDLPQFHFRLWLFITLMRLAVWVGGFGGVEFIPMQDIEKEREP